MKKYEYKVILMKIDKVWTGKPTVDYLNILNDMGREGWRFKEFVSASLRPKGVRDQEILFEREILD